MSLPPVSTIGYERATLDDVIGRLQAGRVDIVLDVRAIAASRRSGFYKTLLSGSLNEAGIAYRHLRALGTPKPGRDAARAGRTAEMRAIYLAHLTEPASQLELALACEIAAHRPTALLCFEADANCCHRAIVADFIRERTGCHIVNL